MAQITITGKFTLDEARLITKLLVEGHRRRQAQVIKLRGEISDDDIKNKVESPAIVKWKTVGQEMLAIEAIQRELGSR
jgi:hypothetical protein